MRIIVDTPDANTEIHRNRKWDIIIVQLEVEVLAFLIILPRFHQLMLGDFARLLTT